MNFYSWIQYFLDDGIDKSIQTCFLTCNRIYYKSSYIYYIHYTIYIILYTFTITYIHLLNLLCKVKLFSNNLITLCKCGFEYFVVSVLTLKTTSLTNVQLVYRDRPWKKENYTKLILSDFRTKYLVVRRL